MASGVNCAARPTFYTPGNPRPRLIRGLGYVLAQLSLPEESIMKNTLQRRNWISRMRLPAASAALALAVVLATAVITTQSAQAQTFTTLHSFDGADGGYALAPLVQATNGNLYGTTNQGGPNSYGNVFKITPSGTLTSLYSFCSQSTCPDGDSPGAGLVQATNGKLYGTTPSGGSTDGGTISPRGTAFEITPNGTLTTLYSFNDADSGANIPIAGLVQATNGYLYGTANFGGPNGGGTVFKMTLSGTLTTLYNFCNIPIGYGGCDGGVISTYDGMYPVGGLLQATNGSLYGTTSGGGNSNGSYGAYGAGTVFKITASGGLTILYRFCSQSNCQDGFGPASSLVQATNGNFYGTTTTGGANGYGTIFEISPAGELTTLYSFCSQSGCADGGYGVAYGAEGALIQATDGNFYGTTSYGGNTSGGTLGFGTIFKITPGGALTTLYTFCTQSNCSDGAHSYAGLVQATNGTFYGTTATGGVNSCAKDGGTCGTVFSLSVGLGPFIETQPTSGLVGAAVKILGTGLTGATSVTFNGTAATFTVVSSSEITTTVPTGATSGKVKVTTPGGTLTSNVNFRVTP